MSGRRALAGVIVVGLLAASGFAFAQFGGRMGRGGRGGLGPGGGFGSPLGFDPAQTRQQLMSAGATEADLLAIEEFRTTQRGAMQPLLRAWVTLREAAGENATDEQAAQAVGEYEALKAGALRQLATAEGNLRTQLELPTKPKLHALLLSTGVLDNGLRAMGGMRGGPPGGRGGFGPAPGASRGPGPGQGGPGGFGGRRGGPGGPGGPRGAAASFDTRTLPNSDAEARILAVLQEVERSGGRWMANVPPEDGRLLRVLTEAIGAKHVVEIGTSNGYSALWLCAALRGTGGKLTTHEIDAQRVALARDNFRRAGVDDIATVVEGDAHQTVASIKESIDLLFIDADKEGYLDYLSKLLPLVPPGGLVVAHNMSPGMADPGYVEAITTDPKLETIFLSGVGVTLRKR